MNREKDPDLDMEKGCNELPPEEPLRITTKNSNKYGRLWKAAVAILTVGIVVFVVAYSVKRTRDDSGTSPSSETKEEPRTFTSTDGAFNVSLGLFNKDITSGYGDTKALEDDLSNAAKFLLNNVIKRNTREAGYGGMGPIEEKDMASDGAPESAPQAASDGFSNAAGGKLNDFGQNNQEDDVEEGDMMVSNGKFVFAAYGDQIVAWDAASGELLTKVQMPPIEIDEKPLEFPEPVVEPIPEPILVPDEGADEPVTSPKISIMPGFYNNKPSVRHLLIEGDRLMVIVEGYGQMFREALSKTQEEIPVMFDYMATNIRLYDIVGPEDGVIRLHSEKHVNGRFMSVRAINGNAHIVTHSGLDTYTHLIDPFESYRHPDLTKDEYVNMVKRTAEEDAIPKFVSRLMKELKEPTGAMPNLFRLSLMQSDVSGTNLEEQVFADGVVNSIAQVYSFNMLADSANNELEVSVSGSFLDSWYTRVYSSGTTMILAGDGWEYDAESGESKQSTHLLGVSLNGATSSPGSIGTVEGSFLNSRSLDVVGNVLRIATTIQNSWFFLPVEPLPVDEEPLLEEPFLEPDNKRDEAPKEEPVDLDTTVSSNSASGGSERKLQEDESRTENYIINLDLSAPDGIMQELGRVKLGKPNEVFTSVRFFDKIAYAVTFEQRDPLYALDLSDPKNPFVISELDVTGFSSYLHSLNPPENTLLLGMGQEADETGQIVGFQISIFDLADPDEPKLLQRHVVENDENSYSYSTSEWDFMATRVVAGRLIIPLDIDNWEDESKSFHGFAVFIVNENEIEEKCRIAHQHQTIMHTADVAVDNIAADEPMMNMCFYCGSELPRRSMIFNGNLMTTQGAIVKSTDMETCVQVWELDVTDGDQDELCCGYIY